MRKLTIKDFATAHEFEAHKREVRKNDRSRRQSPQGRKGYNIFVQHTAENN